MAKNRDIFHIVFQTINDYPWLEKRRDALSDLLSKECATDEEVSTVTDIIKKFKFINNNEYIKHLERLTESIINQKGAEDSNSQIVAMAADANSDSSQKVLYDLKMKLQEKDWEDHISVNRYDHSFKAFKRNSERHNNIFLVDDFIGSGRTAIGRAQRITQMYKDAGHDNICIKIRTLVSTEEGLKKITKEGIDADSMVTIKKAIDDYFPSDTAEKKRNAMKRIEKNLSPIYKEREMPSLGFGGCQAAYYIEESNASNNVFPIFWWPRNAVEKKRKTILVRAAGDA